MVEHIQQITDNLDNEDEEMIVAVNAIYAIAYHQQWLSRSSRVGRPRILPLEQLRNGFDSEDSVSSALDLLLFSNSDHLLVSKNYSLHFASRLQ